LESTCNLGGKKYASRTDLHALTNKESQVKPRARGRKFRSRWSSASRRHARVIHCKSTITGPTYCRQDDLLPTTSKLKCMYRLSTSSLPLVRFWVKLHFCPLHLPHLFLSVDAYLASHLKLKTVHRPRLVFIQVKCRFKRVLKGTLPFGTFNSKIRSSLNSVRSLRSPFQRLFIPPNLDPRCCEPGKY